MLGIGGYISAAGIDEVGVLRSYALVGVAICDIGEKGYERKGFVCQPKEKPGIHQNVLDTDFLCGAMDKDSEHIGSGNLQTSILQQIPGLLKEELCSF